MKRLVVALSLFVGLNSCFSASAPAPDVTIELQKENDKKKTKPLVSPRIWTDSRNLLIFLDNIITAPLEWDAEVIAFLESLVFPSNYSILVSTEVVHSFINKYKLYLDIINPEIPLEKIKELYPESSKHFLKHSHLENIRKHFMNKPNYTPTDQLTVAINDEKFFNVLNTLTKANLFDQWMIAKVPIGFYVLLPKAQFDSTWPFARTAFAGEPMPFSFMLNRRNALASYEGTTLNLLGNRFCRAFSSLLKNKAKRMPRPLNVMISGHGYDIPGKESIVNLEENAFNTFLNILKKNNTHSLFYSTCYGGGKHSVTKLAGEFPFIIIAHGTTDTTVDKNFISYLDVSKYFTHINSDSYQALEQIINKTKYQKQSIHESIENEFKIKQPNTAWFSLAKSVINLKTISKNKALTAALEGTPIVLKDTAYGLLTRTLLSVQFPSQSKDLLLVGLTASPTPDKKVYAIKELVMNEDGLFWKRIIKILNATFDPPFKSSARNYHSKFYIEKLTTKTLTYSDVIITENFIAITHPKDDLIVFNRLTHSTSPNLPPEQKRNYNLVFNRGNTLIGMYEEAVQEVQHQGKYKPKKQDSPFALLKHRLETESFSKALENYANEALKDFSKIEQMVIKSVIEEKKAIQTNL